MPLLCFLENSMHCSSPLAVGHWQGSDVIIQSCLCIYGGVPLCSTGVNSPTDSMTLGSVRRVRCQDKNPEKSAPNIWVGFT